MRRALVTGAGGFVGRHLVAELQGHGWEVLPLTRAVADLADPAAVTAALRGVTVDAVVLAHAARGATDPARRRDTLRVNALADVHVLEALRPQPRPPAVVRLGSSTEYAASPLPMDEQTPVRPRGWFGATKAAGTLLCQAAARDAGWDCLVLRAFQVYGPGDHPHRFVPTVLQALASGSPLALTEADSRRDWVEVGDVVRAVRLAAERLLDGPVGVDVVNLGTGRQHSNAELVAVAEEVTGRVARLVGTHPAREWDTGDWVCDPALAADVLGWQAATDLSAGLARAWSVDHPDAP